MAEQFTSFIVANDKAFSKELQRIGNRVSDFRIPFGLITKDFYRSNRKLFTLKGTGLYPDLSDKYKTQKKRQVGFIYPILFKEGALAASLLSPQGAGAEYSIGRKTLVLGTNIKYAIYHQSDKPRKKLPQRKMVFIDGGPAERARDASIAGRRERWFNILRDYEKQVLTGGI